MTYIHTTTIALHVVFGAAWFGLAIALSILSKEAVRAESRGAAVASLTITTSMSGSAVVFYVFAVLNVVLGSQIGIVYGWPYHAALTLGLGLLAVQFALIRPAAQAMRSNLGTPVGRSARTRLGLGLGTGHALWFAMLILMYLNRTGA